MPTLDYADPLERLGVKVYRDRRGHMIVDIPPARGSWPPITIVLVMMLGNFAMKPVLRRFFPSFVDLGWLLLPTAVLLIIFICWATGNRLRFARRNRIDIGDRFIRFGWHTFPMKLDRLAGWTIEPDAKLGQIRIESKSMRPLVLQTGYDRDALIRLSERLHELFRRDLDD